MTTKTRSIGKRGIVFLPKTLRDRFGLREGARVTVEAGENGILIRPVSGVPQRRRRQRTAVERVVERAEDRFDRREARRLLSDPENQERIPWEQVEEELGL